MNVIALGAGQDVGRSCIIVTFNNKTIMFDCGMHMGYKDGRRFPDFSYISSTGNFDKIIDCIIISHFHLDHCGALVYFTEKCHYTGPVYMTHPTKAVCPILLNDYSKIINNKVSDSKKFTGNDIINCFKKVVCININETYRHDDDMLITPYYAGHVIGAAMFHVKVGNSSVVYTGDYNTTPDVHLGTAWIDCLKPDLLITESTYGSVTRDCRKSKEREFLKSVYNCVVNKGKVLIPIFALGRAQELCLLIDAYWDRMGLSIPVYFNGGLAEKATDIYKRFINYTNSTVRNQILERNIFEYKHIKVFHPHCLDAAGPMVVFSSPGMLHSGQSLKIFKEWCEDPMNLLIMPGYCVRGTVGEKVLNGQKIININGEDKEINIKIKNLAFSAHADAQGILKIISQCKPKNVMLVHGERKRMKVLKKSIETKLGIPTFYPRNGVLVNFPINNSIDLKIKAEDLEKFCDLSKAENKVSLELTLGNIDSMNCIKVNACKGYIDSDDELT